LSPDNLISVLLFVTALSTQLQVTDRPVTQQGLGGPKTAGVRGGTLVLLVVVVLKHWFKWHCHSKTVTCAPYKSYTGCWHDMGIGH